jgi:hypothetical protein
VRAFLAQRPGVSRQALEQLAPDTNFWTLDPTLDLVDVVSSIERAFAIRVHPLDFLPENFNSLARVIRFVTGQEARSAPVPPPAPGPRRPAAWRDPATRTAWLLLALLVTLTFALKLSGLRWGFAELSPLRRGAGYLAVLAAAGFFLAATGRRRRFLALLAGSAVVYPLFLHLGALLVALYVGLVCGLARVQARLRFRLALALVLWAALPLARFTFFPLEWREHTVALIIVWVGLIYSTLYLLIERRRGYCAPEGLLGEVLYLVAFPRMVEPFFQPLPLRAFFGSLRPAMIPTLARRGFLLGLYGLALSVVGRQLHASLEPTTAPIVHLGVAFVVFYCHSAAQVFVSIALFRLLGFDLGSGFNRPFLSRSFVDFYRRWNYYVRAAVVRLFFFPLLGAFRRRLPHRLAIYAATYGGILGGSYLLNDLFVPLVTATEPIAGAAVSLNAPHLVTLAFFWTGVLFSAHLRTGIITAPTPTPAPGARRKEIVRVVLFFLLYLGTFSAAWSWTHLSR